MDKSDNKVSNILRLILINLLLPVTFVFAEGFENPVKAGSIEELLVLVINAVIILLMPIVILAIIYSGFMFLTARGNKEQLTTAKTNFVWVVVGVAVLLGAKVIATVIENSVEHIVK